MLPSKINQIKVSHKTGSEANFGFGRGLMPSYLGMCPPKAAFFSFRMQPNCAFTPPPARASKFALAALPTTL